jgi:hypothetical protein
MQRVELMRALVLAGCIVASAAAWAASEDRAPSWAALTIAQQQALAPLKRDWPSIDTNRKQKWLEVAARFPKMPADERARIQERMAAWAALTPTERARARLQFQETRTIGPEERQARWQAYQALPEEDRRRLAQAAKPTPRPGNGAPSVAAPQPGTRSGPSGADVATAKRNVVVPAQAPPPRAVAPTVVQAKPGATTTTMAIKASPPVYHQPGLPKIVATPGFVDQATLLPRRGPQGAAVRAAAASESTPRP